MFRRRFLATVASTSALALTGCTTGSEDATTDTSTTGESDSGESDNDGTDELDLREANVTGVSVEQTGEGVRFDVTLHHDDDDEDGYANWWQLERLDGTRLGRRELAHAHGTREFTRSATIEVPDDSSCVVVRGHDETHGYGGQAMLVSVTDGATTAVQQGAEPRTFGATDCP